MSSQPNFLTQPPPPLPARPIHLPTAYETVLPNGLELVVVEDKRLPLVSYRLAFRKGDAHDPADVPGLMDMMTGLLTEGTKSRTSREIADETARLGAVLQAGANSDYTTVAASSLSSFGEEILALMAEVALTPVFPENEVDLARQNTKESLKQQRAQPSFLASEMVARVMFGKHPYHVTSPTPESVDATTRERLVEFHRSVFIPNNAVLFVIGDVKQGDIQRQVEALFGDWQPGNVGRNQFPAPPKLTSRTAYIVDRPGSAQANIVIANAGLVRTSPDYFPMLVTHTVLGANASSRLFMNLREEKGYTYGAYSSLDARRLAGTFRATAEVRTPVAGDSLKEFFYELERIRTALVSQKEIDDAKSYLTGVFPIRLETQEGLIDQLVQIKMFGLPQDYLETYRQNVQAVTIDQVQEAAVKYVTPDSSAIVIVGDGAELADQVEPHSPNVEFFNTAGKPKSRPTKAEHSKEAAAKLAGTWSLSIESPLGQSIPATLTLRDGSNRLSGEIKSEMGNGELTATCANNGFKGTVVFDVAGQQMTAQIEGEIQDSNVTGTISLENVEALNFTGSKNPA
jgi:zinc protease